MGSASPGRVPAASGPRSSPGVAAGAVHRRPARRRMPRRPAGAAAGPGRSCRRGHLAARRGPASSAGRTHAAASPHGHGRIRTGINASRQRHLTARQQPFPQRIRGFIRRLRAHVPSALRTRPKSLACTYCDNTRLWLSTGFTSYANGREAPANGGPALSTGKGAAPWSLLPHFPRAARSLSRPGCRLRDVTDGAPSRATATSVQAPQRQCARQAGLPSAAARSGRPWLPSRQRLPAKVSWGPGRKEEKEG